MPCPHEFSQKHTEIHRICQSLGLVYSSEKSSPSLMSHGSMGVAEILVCDTHLRDGLPMSTPNPAGGQWAEAPTVFPPKSELVTLFYP